MTGRIACQRVLAVFLSLSLLSHCGGQVINEYQSAGNSASESETMAGLPIVGGQIQELSLNGDDATIDLNIANNENAVLLLVGLDGAGATQGFQLGTSGNSDAKSLVQTSFKDKIAEAALENGDITEIVHGKLRKLEKKIPDDTPLAQPQRQRFAKKTDARKNLTDEGVKSFKVLTSFSANDEYTLVTAQRYYDGHSFDVYVDERDLEAFEGDELTAVVRDFENRLDDETALFGAPSDVNGDEEFTVLLTREINALGESYGGLITGYFYATDLFDAGLYPSSNESEILYAMVPNPDGALGKIKVSRNLYMNNILPGVLPHEYQHMANFNAHRFLNATGAESSWLNEGLSHLAEDIYSLDEYGYMGAAGIENPSRVLSYLNNVDNTCFTCGTTLSQRGGAYLFLRYLYEQAELGNLAGSENGFHFVWSLTAGDARDIRNISRAISGNPSDTEAFRDALARFGLAIYLSGSDETYDDEFEITGLDLRGPQDDNRGTILSGPAILTAEGLPLTATLSGYSVAYVQIPGSALDATSGKFDLKVADGSKFKAYLIQ